MPSETEAAAIDTPGVEVEEDSSLEALGRDIAIQKKRIKSVADHAEVAGTPLDAISVMRELHSNVLPLMADLVGFMDRLEEHADWASEHITELIGESETSSQITSGDAARLRDFLVEVGVVFGNQAEKLLADSQERNYLASLSSGATDLVKLIEEIELTKTDGDGDDEDDDTDDETPAPEAVPLAAVSADAATPPVGEPAPEP